MKGSKFETIRWIVWPGIFVVLALGGCGTSVATPPPTSMLTTASVPVITPVFNPTATPISTSLTAYPMPIPTSSIVRRDNDTGWRHYWASSSQQIFVNTLTIDGQWLWIATTKGVIRLNQHSLEYQLYPSTGASPDIALDQVYTLAVDDQGRLWAAGARGLARYTNTSGWKVIYTGDRVTNFALDHQGNLWYWNYWNDSRIRPTVYRFQGQEPPAVGDWQLERVEWQDSFRVPSNWRFFAGSSKLPNNQKDASGNIWSWEYSLAYDELVIYRNGQVTHTIIQAGSDYAAIAAEAGVWIKSEGNRLFYSNGQSLRQYRFTDGKATISPPRVSSLAFTADGNGWATTSEGLFRFSNETEKWEMTKMNITAFDEASLKLVVSDQQSDILLALPDPRIEAALKLVVSDQQSSLWAYNNMVVSDQESSLWAYNNRYGGFTYLAYFDGQLWQIWPAILDRCRWDSLKTVTEYQGDVWFTTLDKDCGLWHFDGQTFENFELPPIHSLTTDHNAKLYAITSKGAILIYNGTDWQQLPDCTECNELGLILDYAITVDATGRVWRTCRDTTRARDSNTYPYRRYSETYSIWRYSMDQGWCHILTLEPGPYYVRSLLIDAYGDLWVLLSSDEVLRCNQENCEAWTFGGDQPFEAPITAMAMDPQGRIWVGGYGLLSVYDPAVER